MAPTIEQVLGRIRGTGPANIRRQRFAAEQQYEELRRQTHNAAMQKVFRYLKAQRTNRRAATGAYAPRKPPASILLRGAPRRKFVSFANGTAPGVNAGGGSGRTGFTKNELDALIASGHVRLAETTAAHKKTYNARLAAFFKGRELYSHMAPPMHAFFRRDRYGIMRGMTNAQLEEYMRHMFMGRK